MSADRDMLLDRAEAVLAGLIECHCRPAPEPGQQHSIGCVARRKAAAEAGRSLLADLRGEAS